MGIAGVGTGNLAGKPQASGGDASADIKALEQKLQKLKDEKQKASAAGNGKAEREFQRKIQEIEKQIEELKQQGSKTKTEKLPERFSSKTEKPYDAAVGKYVDESV